MGAMEDDHRDGATAFQQWLKSRITPLRRGTGFELCLAQRTNEKGTPWISAEWLLQVAQWAATTPLPAMFRALLNINVSIVNLDDAGCDHLVGLLETLQTPVQVLKLHKNLLSDEAVPALCRVLENSKHTVRELHLSHNRFTMGGATQLLLTAAAAGPPGRPKYPFVLLEKNRLVPLWLRLEFNDIDCSRGWDDVFQDWEAHMRQRMRQAGHQRAADSRERLICTQSGCKATECSQLTPGCVNLAAPLVALPFIQSQGQDRSGPAGSDWNRSNIHSWARSDRFRAAPVRERDFRRGDEVVLRDRREYADSD